MAALTPCLNTLPPLLLHPARSGQFMTDQLSEELQYSQALVQPLLACLQVRALPAPYSCWRGLQRWSAQPRQRRGLHSWRGLRSWRGLHSRDSGTAECCTVAVQPHGRSRHNCAPAPCPPLPHRPRARRWLSWAQAAPPTSCACCCPTCSSSPPSSTHSTRPASPT